MPIIIDERVGVQRKQGIKINRFPAAKSVFYLSTALIARAIVPSRDGAMYLASLGAIGEEKMRAREVRRSDFEGTSFSLNQNACGDGRRGVYIMRQH